MRYEVVEVKGVRLTVYFTVDGALGDPPDMTFESVEVVGNNILPMLNEETIKEIEEAVWRLR